VFGDSLVSDEIYLEFDDWVRMLRKFLNLKEEASIFNLGIGGETSTGLFERIDTECKARNPDIIIVRIGANDARYNNITENSVEIPIDKFKDNIKNIIDICKKFTKEIIFIGNLPCVESKTTPTIWSPTEYFYNTSLEKYNNLMKEICNREKILFLDLFDEWLKIDYEKFLLDDGLHPNAEGHKKIFEAVKDFLIRNKVI